MRLSEIKGDRALDVLADIIEPVTDMAQDPEVIALFKGVRKGGEDNKAYAMRQIKKHIPGLIRNHKTSIVAILAALDGEDPHEYAEKLNLFTVPLKLFEILTDPDMTSLFTLATSTPDLSNVASAKSKG
jgi:hypothetical protein